jgi:hypothetical protein
MTILDLLKRPATTAADLRSKLGEIETSLPALRTLVDAAEAERSRGLLVLGDKELETIEAKLARAKRDRDRALAAQEELARQLADAERREGDEALSRRRSEAEKRAAKVARRLSVEYVAAARSIVELLHDLHAVETEVIELNTALAHAGRGDEVVVGAEARALPASRTGVMIGLLRATSLPPCGTFEGVGPARAEAERHGIVR